MSKQDTKLLVSVERPGYWKANAELSEKGLDDLTERVKRPLTNLGLKLAVIALSVGLFALSGKTLVQHPIVRSILPILGVEQKSEQ